MNKPQLAYIPTNYGDAMNAQAVRTGIALALMLVATLTVMSWGRLGYRREALTASARAFVQLILVALVIAWIFTHPQFAFVYLVIMLGAATYTANRRIGGDNRDRVGVLIAIACGSSATVFIVAITGALDFTAQTLLPFSAQMIGGAMTTASLAGVRFRDDVKDQWPIFEGWLAIGAAERQAGRTLAQRAAEKSLFPTIDQTKSAGLVTLPGAFVGMLLGGASPLLAAQIQLLVLVGLLLSQTITALLTVQLIRPVGPSS